MRALRFALCASVCAVSPLLSQATASIGDAYRTHVWTYVPDPAGVFRVPPVTVDVGVDVRLKDVAIAPNYAGTSKPGYVIVGSVPSTDGHRIEGAVWASADGVTWERAPELPGSRFSGSDRAVTINGVAVVGSRLVAVGNESLGSGSAWQMSGVAWWSSDGLTWVRDDGVVEGLIAANYAPGSDPLISVGSINDVASNGDVAVAVGVSGGRATIWRKVAGGSWVRVLQEPDASPMPSLIYHVERMATQFVAFGVSHYRCTLWRSVDGAKWTKTQPAESCSLGWSEPANVNYALGPAGGYLFGYSSDLSKMSQWKIDRHGSLGAREDFRPQVTPQAGGGLLPVEMVTGWTPCCPSGDAAGVSSYRASAWTAPERFPNPTLPSGVRYTSARPTRFAEGLPYAGARAMAVSPRTVIAIGSWTQDRLLSALPLSVVDGNGGVWVWKPGLTAKPPARVVPHRN